MSVSTHKLYYRRAGTTYSIELYTSLADIGSPTHYFSQRIGDSTLYAPVSTDSDSNDSYLRCRISGSTYIVKSKYKVLMTQAAFISYIQGYVANGATRSISAGQFTLYHSTTAYDTTVPRHVFRSISQVARSDSSGPFSGLTGFACIQDYYTANSTTPASTTTYSSATTARVIGSGVIALNSGDSTTQSWIVSIDVPFVFV